MNCEGEDSVRDRRLLAGSYPGSSSRNPGGLRDQPTVPFKVYPPSARLVADREPRRHPNTSPECNSARASMPHHNHVVRLGLTRGKQYTSRRQTTASRTHTNRIAACQPHRKRVRMLRPRMCACRPRRLIVAAPAHAVTPSNRCRRGCTGEPRARNSAVTIGPSSSCRQTPHILIADQKAPSSREEDRR